MKMHWRICAKKKDRAVKIALCCVLLAGCGKKESVVSEVSSSVSQEPVKKNIVWAVEPTMEFTDVKNIEALRQGQMLVELEAGGYQAVIVDAELTGYPAQWLGSGYAANAVAVEKAGKAGIYDYYGNELYPIQIRVNATPFSKGVSSGLWFKEQGDSESAIGYADSSTGKSYVFSKDFKETTEVAYDDFFFFFFRGNVDYGTLAYKNGVLGVLYRLVDANGQVSATQAFEACPREILPYRCIIDTIDDSFARQSRQIISKDGSFYAGIVNGRGKYQEKTYVNGFYMCGTGTEKAFVNAASATQISLDYHDGLYFEDGYAPVKKYGKWGFINENGEEVTDFIFDDATALYDGLAWVKYDDKWGVLKLAKSLESGVDITLSECYGYDLDEEVIGRITVLVSNLNFRDNPGTGGANCGIARENISYPVYETQQDENYTWYRVDGSHWLADKNGEWLMFGNE